MITKEKLQKRYYSSHWKTVNKANGFKVKCNRFNPQYFGTLPEAIAAAKEFRGYFNSYYSVLPFEDKFTFIPANINSEVCIRDVCRALKIKEYTPTQGLLFVI
jgi:hypothetical protein